MPDMAIGFQLSLELTKAFPVREAAVEGGKLVKKLLLDLARRLRNSGSDILVEEDLAAVFGRGMVAHGLETRFKEEIIQNTKVSPIYDGCLLALSIGAGPTVERALRDTHTGYMATIIQLSFLGWVHDRTGLAEALADCLEKRFEMSVSGASPSPGFQSIYGMLEVCSSQTASFSWSRYLDDVSDRLDKVFSLDRLLYNRSDINHLSRSTLLACMDFLYIIQRTPEERTMTVSEPRGIATLIVWAHHILGITVIVTNTSGSNQVTFSSEQGESPNMIIHWEGDSFKEPEICLFDSQTEVMLKIDEDLAGMVRIEHQERLRLQDYGTQILCRVFNRSSAGFIGDPVSTEAVQFTVAMALLLAQKLTRILDLENGVPLAGCGIQRWQIFDAASVMFSTVHWDEAAILSYMDHLTIAMSLREILPPRALLEALPKWEQTGHVPTICSLAISVLVMGAVRGIKACGELLIIAEEHSDTTTFHAKAIMGKGYISLNEDDLFLQARHLLVGPREMERRDENIVLISDFGWTIFLGSFGDSGPTSNPAQLGIGKGVPTNPKTGDRKSRVLDAVIGMSMHPGRSQPSSGWVIDRGQATYQPRCVSPVTERKEFYGTRMDSFHLMITFRGQHTEHPDPAGRPSTFEMSQCCLDFHRAYWKTFVAPTCQHMPHSPGSNRIASLGLDIATAAGNWSWITDNKFPRRSHRTPERTPDDATASCIPERIVIILTKGDSRARWLAVGRAINTSKTRQTMLRSRECCEDCAVKAAAVLPGKWIVVL